MADVPNAPVTDTGAQDVPTANADVPSMMADVPTGMDVPSMPTDVPMADDRPTPVDTFVPPVDAQAVGPYPAAPYGSNMGDTIENLAFQGHLVTDGRTLSNTQPLDTMLNLQRIRETGRRYALIHTSAFY